MMSIDERLERLVSAAELRDRQIEADRQQLVELRDLFQQQNAAHEQQIEAHKQQNAAHEQQIEANRQQLVGLRDLFQQQNAAHDRRIEAHDRQIEANRQQLAQLQNWTAELREANVLLVQMVSKQQDELQQYKKTTNAALDRIDRTLMLLFEQRNNGHAN